MALNLYIDESGSMTEKYSSYKPFFVISIIKVKNANLLRKYVKRFVADNYKTLKKIDKNNKMFINEKFHELKGSELNKALKIKFIHEICKNDCLEIYFIKLLNSKVDKKFFQNKARAFNYLLKLFLTFVINQKHINHDDEINLQIDERNVKTQAKYQLTEYLNTELIFTSVLNKPLTATYYDSSNNSFIQVADIFANIFFSDCMTNGYKDVLNQLKINGYLKEIFTFPLNHHS